MPVRVIRSAQRRRTIAFTVDNGAIVVRAPVRTANRNIVELLKKRQAWILARLAAPPTPPERRTFGSGETVPYLGSTLTLRVVHGKARRPTVHLEGDALVIQQPAPAHDPESTPRAVEAWYRARAAEVFSELVQRWSPASGLVPARVLVANQRRRWGSCGPDGTLRLNWRLLLAAPELVEYVVVHELAHIRHRHHQAAFWEEVAGMLPDHRERRRLLTAIGPTLVL